MNTRFALLLGLALLLFPFRGLASSGEDHPPPTRSRTVAVTFDDLPSSYGNLERITYVTERILRSLRTNDVPAIGFVNERKVLVRGEMDARTALLWRWLEAGHDLGNHTFSHIAIDRVPFEAYREDLLRGETVTRMLLESRGRNLRYFRHTQLRTGPTEEYKNRLDALLAERGYRVAPVTIDSNEYLFAHAYERARDRGDTETMKRIAEAYVPYMEEVVAHFERLSMEFLGYEVRQTLLLHANGLNADHFDDLATMLRERGYRFITLDEALQDQAYRLPEARATKGLSWLHRWMLARGIKMKPEPPEPDFIRELSNGHLHRGLEEQGAGGTQGQASLIVSVPPLERP